jgi:hypothetical protein
VALEPDNPDPEMISAYAQGREAFEHGYYREAVERLLKAISLVHRQSQLGGEMQIWLITAYEAVGRQEEAISLCRQLQHHPHLETRKQSKRLLYILEAPKLQKKAEWLTQIPDLSHVNEPDLSERLGVGKYTPAAPKSRSLDPDPIDLNQVDTKDNNFVWVALGLLLLLLGAWVWWG